MRAFASEIWLCDGPTVRAAGVPFSTRMIVVRLGDGSLWINSPVSIATRERHELDALGPVRYLVAPTPFHVWRLAAWAALYPKAELWGPPRMRRRRHPAFTNVLGPEAPSGWSADLDQLVFEGNALLSEVYFLHRRSGTLIVGDTIQIYPERPDKPLLDTLMRLAGIRNGGVPLDVRLSFTNRTAARTSLSRLLAWNFDRLVVAHGDCLETGAKPFVERAFRWLGRRRPRGAATSNVTSRR
jgi:hypothetical protein